MSSPAASPKIHPRRTSRFTEGDALTGIDLLSQTSSPSHLSLILSEMDTYEQRRRASNPPSPTHTHHHHGSNSSTDSFASTASAIISAGEKAERDFAPKEGRRSITFGRNSAEISRNGERCSFDGAREPLMVVKGIRGRLRALTASKIERRSRANS